jgi:hypothetical protein
LKKFEKSYKSGTIEKDVIEFLLTSVETSLAELKNVRNDRIEFERDILNLNTKIGKLENEKKSTIITIDH